MWTIPFDGTWVGLSSTAQRSAWHGGFEAWRGGGQPLLWRDWCRWLRAWSAQPFDCVRHQHAASVQAGALPRSLLESQRFEQQLGLLEKLSLGPLARRV